MQLESIIDPTCSAEQSIILRYRNGVRVGATDAEDAAYKACLVRTSQQEGARILSLMTYKGVSLFLLDETSLMFTRTMRSIAGCVITAKSVHHGYQAVVFESGGNSGAALSAYGQCAGLETFFFLPAENLPLMNSQLFRSPKTHLIAVEKPGLVKRATQLFHQRTGVPHIPRLDWRYEASRYRGFFLLEHMLAEGPFDWIIQTISAAFGPIGIYKILEEYRQVLGGLPRFLGVQQAANCPMYRTWKADGQPVEAIEIDSTDGLLSRIMYDVHPHTYGTYDELRQLLADTEGTMLTIDEPTFWARLETRVEGEGVLDRLAAQGITFPRFEGEIIERTGLIALAGTLRAIDEGIIAPGSRVLCCLTSGMTQADGQAVPEALLPADGLEQAVEDYCSHVRPS
jgi:threonine synthase